MPDKKSSYKEIISTLSGLLMLFFVVLIVWIGVDISSKIKESKYIGQDVASKNTIQITATGDVFSVPDLALTNFSVVTENKTVDEALSENTTTINNIIDFLKNQGIEDKDIKTVGFNIYPIYEYVDQVQFTPSGKRLLSGYEVRNSLQVKIRNLDKIGSLIQGSAERGANQIGDLQFTVENQDELKNQARENAIYQAKTKAKKLASQLGVNLGKIISFSESTGFPIYYQSSIAEDTSRGGASPQIEPGENKIEVTVNIIYEIN